MTTLRVSKQLYEQEGKDLLEYLKSSFKTVIDVTTRDDRGDIKYLLSGFDCDEIDLWFSDDPELKGNGVLPQFKGRFVVCTVCV